MTNFFHRGEEVFISTPSFDGNIMTSLVCRAFDESTAKQIAGLLANAEKQRSSEMPFKPVFSTASNAPINIFRGQIKTMIDLNAMQASWRLPQSMSVKDSFPIGIQTVPVLVVDDQQQLKNDLSIIKFACQEEGYGLDAVARIEKILTQPNATSQIVWAKKEEIERAKLLGGSFNVWITRYSDLDTAMLLPPQEMVQKRSSLERTQKTKVNYPPPM